MANLIGNALGQVEWFAAFGQAFNMVGMLLIAVVILAIFFTVGHVISFKIKATVFPMYGSGKDGIFSVGKPKKNRVKWNKQRNAWFKLYPLFSKKEIEPFDSEYIYQGNNIYVSEFNDQWTPIKIDVGEIENKQTIEFKTIPHSVRNWQSLMHQKHEVEFARQGFWEENRNLLVTLGVVFCLCCLVGATMYFHYKFAGGSRSDAKMVATAIDNMMAMAGGQVPR